MASRPPLIADTGAIVATAMIKAPRIALLDGTPLALPLGVALALKVDTGTMVRAIQGTNLLATILSLVATVTFAVAPVTLTTTTAHVSSGA